MVFSLFLFLRGHNAPGGGFIGGLVASSAIILFYLAFGLVETDRIFRVDYITVASTGLLCAGAAGLLPMFFGHPFLTSLFWHVTLPLVGPFDLSTVLLFDLGVYLAVIGTMVGTVRTLVLERRWQQVDPSIDAADDMDEEDVNVCTS